MSEPDGRTLVQRRLGELFLRSFAPWSKRVDSEKIDDVLRELVDHVAGMQKAFERIAARSVAHQVMLQVLLQAHTNPVELFELYAGQLDALALTSPTASDGDFREELQHFQSLILRAVNNKKSRS